MNDISELLNAKQSVEAFLDDINRLKYNSEFAELSFSRGKKNYERILTYLNSLELPNPNTFRYQTVSFDELKQILYELMIKILGENFKNKLDQLSQLIRLRDLPYFNSTVDEQFIYQDRYGQIIKNSTSAASISMKTKAIYISNQLYTIQVSSTGHEYTHALQSQFKGDKFNNTFTNIHYNELLSILVEYILSYELSKMLNDPNIVSSHEVIRIHHDHEQARELHDSRALSVQLNRAKYPANSFYRDYVTYQEHNAFTYIIGDIYSVHLLELYKDDNQSINGLIRAILKGEKSLLELIKHYDLSLRNAETIDLYKKQIERTLKYTR